MSENEIDYEGVKLVAVEQENCDGCFFRNLSCGYIETPCSSSRRQDGRPVIWVPKGELLGATDKALTHQAASSRQIAGDHYKKMGIEPWDVIDTWPLEQRIGAYRAGALKYLMRMGSKDESAQEIAKGQHYMEKLLEVLRAEP